MFCLHFTYRSVKVFSLLFCLWHHMFSLLLYMICDMSLSWNKKAAVFALNVFVDSISLSQLWINCSVYKVETFLMVPFDGLYLDCFFILNTMTLNSLACPREQFIFFTFSVYSVFYEQGDQRSPGIIPLAVKDAFSIIQEVWFGINIFSQVIGFTWLTQLFFFSDSKARVSSSCIILGNL